MTVFLYILTFILLLIILILISPFRLTIDTISDTYSVKWKGIIQVKLISKNQEPIVSMLVLGFKKDFNLLKNVTKRKIEKNNKKSKSKRSKKITFQKMKQLVKTFTIKSFNLNLDFDDCILNGYLYPIFFFMRSHNRSFKINFVGHNDIQLIIENRPYKLLKAYLF